MENAVPPSATQAIAAVKGEKQFATEDRKDDYDLIRLGDYPEWETFKKVVNGQIQTLGNVEIMEGESVEMYGFRVLAARTTISFLKSLIAMPETVSQAHNDRNNEGK